MELLTIAEAAKRLRLGRSTTYALAERGELPVVRFGKSVRVVAELLDKMIEQQATAHDPNAA